MVGRIAQQRIGRAKSLIISTMPELPEVEVVRRGLAKTLTGKSFDYTRLSNWKKLPDLARVADKPVLGVSRYGKNLFIDLGKYYLVSHLGMSGFYFKTDSLKGIKHGHLAVKYANKKWLVYCDPRRFGNFKLVKKRLVPEIAKERITEGVDHLMLGPDALVGFFNNRKAAILLAERFEENSPKMAVKTALLDQTCISGIGNIYASEILFRAAISPFKPIGELTAKQIAKLADFIPRVMLAAIESKGTTIKGANKYRTVGGKTGSFTNLL